MHSMPTTNASLLLRLLSPSDEQSWQQFVRIYEPALLHWLMGRGLQRSDAEDCAQQVLLSVTKSLAKFVDDGKPASFRRWLQTIARNELVNLLRSKARQPMSNRDSQVWKGIVDLTLDPNALDSNLEREYQRELFIQAAMSVRKSVQPATWDAFWRTSILEQTAPEVAKELGLSLGAIYMAKLRVLQRLKSIVAEMESSP